jgi:hypothetical protein
MKHIAQLLKSWDQRSVDAELERLGLGSVGDAVADEDRHHGQRQLID